MPWCAPQTNFSMSEYAEERLKYKQKRSRFLIVFDHLMLRSGKSTSVYIAHIAWFSFLKWVLVAIALDKKIYNEFGYT